MLPTIPHDGQIMYYYLYLTDEKLALRSKSFAETHL